MYVLGIYGESGEKDCERPNGLQETSDGPKWFLGNDVTEVFHFGAVQNQKGRYTIGLNSYVSKLV